MPPVIRPAPWGYPVKSLFACSTALLALVSTSAHATSADTTSAEADDAIVVSASRSGDAISSDKLAASVTVLEAADLDQRQTRAVSDILRDVPGVAVNRMGGIGGLTQIRIRGSEANHVLVFVDGIKVGDPYTGEFDFGNLLADSAARIEVLRGQQSSLYGSDAIGGVISYTTLSGREAKGLASRAEGGSFGTFNTSARLGGTLGTDADYALTATYLTTHGTPSSPTGTRALTADNLTLSGKVNYTPAANLKLSAVARYSDTYADTNDQGIDASSPVVQGYQTITTLDTPSSYGRAKAFYGLASAALDLLGGAWSQALSGQYTDIIRDNYAAWGYSSGSKGQRYRGSYTSTGRFSTGAAKHRVTLALDAEREEFRTIDPSGYAFTGKNSIDTLGVVGQYDLALGDAATFGAAVRHDANEKFGDATTWRASASYRFNTATRLHGAYGTGVKNPTATELFGYATGLYIGNPNLRPERSSGWEIGLEQPLLGKALTLGATYFNSRFTNQIETTYIFVGGAFLSTTANNAVTSRQSGVEFSARAQTSDWQVNLAYTYLHAPQSVQALVGQNTGGFAATQAVETQAVRRPQDSASLVIAYAPKASPFSANLAIRHNGTMRDYAFNSSYQRLLVDLKAYTLVNLGAAYQINPQVRLYGRLENLLGEKYQEVFTVATAGRAAYGGVSVKF